jgi:hypothetical protein
VPLIRKAWIEFVLFEEAVGGGVGWRDEEVRGEGEV